MNILFISLCIILPTCVRNYTFKNAGNSDISYNTYHFIKWSHSLESLTNHNKEALLDLLDISTHYDDMNSAAAFSNSWQNAKDMRSDFYKCLSRPVKNVCNIAKTFGGQYYSKVNVDIDNNVMAYNTGVAMDGSKCICMDKLYHDVKNQDCLVYSFGLSDDWTFEESMADLGCQVRAFDPTVSAPNTEEYVNNYSGKIAFSKTGLYAFSHENATIDGVSDVEVLTLEDAINRFGDSRRKISILKLDIEGHEFLAVPEFLQSDVLNNVDQIHIEVHVMETHPPWKQAISYYISNFLDTIKELCDCSKYGYRLLYYGPNLMLERLLSENNQYYSYFDIVLYKP